ncbi:cytidine deaminase [Streptomyces sp. NPDC001774]
MPVAPPGRWSHSGRGDVTVVHPAGIASSFQPRCARPVRRLLAGCEAKPRIDMLYAAMHPGAPPEQPGHAGGCVSPGSKLLGLVFSVTREMVHIMLGIYRSHGAREEANVAAQDVALEDAGAVKRLLQRAMREAQRSQCRYRVGALLVAGSRILSCSPNVPRNRPTIDFRHATFHAEEAALRRVRNATGLTIYIVRINAAGESVLARPCGRCQHALAAAGVSRALYSTDTPAVGCLYFRG